MKRFIIPILLVALLLLVGCDQEMRSGFANFLGTFSGNVYLDSGMIPPDHSNAEATVEHIANLGSGENSGTVDDVKIDLGNFGLPGETLDLESTEGIITFLVPQKPADQQGLKNNLEDALGSDSEKEALLNELSKPADGDAKEAAEGTVALLGALLDVLIGENNEGAEFLKDLFPDLDDYTELTQGDVLMLQLMTDLLMTDLVANAAGLFEDGFEGGEGVDREDVLPLVNDVIFAAWVAGEIGETTSLDFSGFGNLGDFINQVAGEGGN